MTNQSNIISSDRMLLVLSAPSVHDPYYAPAFREIVDFQINFARAIMGRDNVLIVVEEDTRSFFHQLPDDILLIDEVQDIWVRDFSTVNPESPVQFQYTQASMSKPESKAVQRSFSDFADRHGIQRQKTDLLLDGGNLVDNYQGRVVTTSRFLKDNKLTVAEGKDRLILLLGAGEVAIVEPDEGVLAHADGMVSWVGEDVLLVNDYSDDPLFRNKVLQELESSFPGVKLVEVPVQYPSKSSKAWEGFESACGINLNAVVTRAYMYVPMFGMPHEEQALRLIREHGHKAVIPVDASGVCAMGGSLRCLSWQLEGDNAAALIRAARED